MTVGDAILGVALGSAAVGVGLLAQGADGSTLWPADWKELGAVGLLGAIIATFLWKVIPQFVAAQQAMADKFDKSLASQREDFKLALNQQNEFFRTSMEATQAHYAQTKTAMLAALTDAVATSRQQAATMHADMERLTDCVEHLAVRAGLDVTVKPSQHK